MQTHVDVLSRTLNRAKLMRFVARLCVMRSDEDANIGAFAQFLKLAADKKQSCFKLQTSIVLPRTPMIKPTSVLGTSKSYSCKQSLAIIDASIQYNYKERIPNDNDSRTPHSPANRASDDHGDDGCGDCGDLSDRMDCS